METSKGKLCVSLRLLIRFLLKNNYLYSFFCFPYKTVTKYLDLKLTNPSAIRLLNKERLAQYPKTHVHTPTHTHRGSDSVILMPSNPVNPFVPDFTLDLPTA